MRNATEIFARIVIALEPYLDDVVFVGGWVHAVYLATDAGPGVPVGTDDIDLTVPRRLLTDGRPPLLELVASVGIERDPASDLHDAPLRLVWEPSDERPGGPVVDLDLLAESATPGAAVPIEGQPGLRAQGYPGQHLLLESTQQVTLGANSHTLFESPRRIRVPTLGAYALHKGISWTTRRQRGKSAKDLVYLFEILRHPRLGPTAITQLRDLAARHPDELPRWSDNLENVVGNRALLREIAIQLIVANRASGDEDTVVAAVSTRFRRAGADVATLPDL